ncbi:MAG: hypothetical protein JWO30_4992 [Fibrobacteres bacterium]|nr:hypothetical protein [Fibrobacterota bacterium]
MSALLPIIASLLTLIAIGTPKPSLPKENAPNSPQELAVFRDSLMRDPHSQEAWLNDFKTALGNCRAHPTQSCLEKAYRDLFLLAESNPKVQYVGEAIDSSAGLILELEGEKGYARLLARVRIDSASTYPESKIIDKLLKARLDRAYDQFCSSPKRAESAPTLAGVPSVAAPGNLPAAFREGWSYRRSLLFEPRRSGAMEMASSVKWTYTELYRDILEFLREEKPAALEPIWNFEWEGWCGTGSQALYGPKGMARLIVQLDRGDFLPALRATQDGERVRQMLMSRGLDWELFFLGETVDNDLEGRDRPMRILARYGSPEAARKLLQLNPDSSYGGTYLYGYEEALGTFLLGPGARLPIGDGTYAESDYVRDPHAAALSADLKRRILERLIGKIDNNPYRINALLFVRILSRFDFPEQGVYLSRLAAVPDRRSRPEALQALKKMGLRPGKLPSLEPVTLLITSNGGRFPDGSLNLGLPCQEGVEPCPGLCNSSSIEGGRCSLDRTSYLYLWHGAGAAHLSHYYPGSQDPLHGSMYGVTIPLVETPEEPLRIDIPLRRVELRFIFPSGYIPRPEKRMRAMFRRLEREAGEYGAPFDMDVRPDLVFTGLGDGAYEFAVCVPGMQPWESGRFEVHGDTTASVGLRKGVDVEYRVLAKGGGSEPIQLKVELRHAVFGVVRRGPIYRAEHRAGQFTDQADIFQGLVPGSYVLEVASGPAAGGSGPAMRQVRKFVITDSTPANIGLGDIRLSPSH